MLPAFGTNGVAFAENEGVNTFAFGFNFEAGLLAALGAPAGVEAVALVLVDAVLLLLLVVDLSADVFNFGDSERNLGEPEL